MVEAKDYRYLPQIRLVIKKFILFNLMCSKYYFSSMQQIISHSFVLLLIFEIWCLSYITCILSFTHLHLSLDQNIASVHSHIG